MTARRFALALVATLAPLAPFALSQDSEIQSLLETRARAAQELDVDELWGEASRLGSLARDINEEQTDRALDQLLRSGGMPVHSELLLVAARLAGEEPDAELLADALEPLLDDPEEPVAIAAAGLLADRRFQLLPAERSEELVEKLLAGAREIERSPELRIAFAVTAYGHGNGQDVRDVQRILMAFLNSSDPALRGRAALALASLGEMLSVRGELERMSVTPGPDGELASAYLKQETLRVHYESRLRRQRAVFDEAPRGREFSGPLDNVDTVMQMILSTHVEGDTVTEEELIDAALDGMLRSMDRHSNYFSSEVYAEFQQDLGAEYGGIGAYVGIDRDDNIFTVTRPIYSGPAYKADVRSDDKIVRIDDWPTHEHGISKPTEDVIRRLKGEPGSIVNLYIWRRGMDPALIERPTEDMIHEVTRGLITIPPVQFLMLPEKIGLIELTSFSAVAGQELQHGLELLLDDGARGIVLDLRGNPGGYLRQARDVADLFLPKDKLVVSTESRMRKPDQLFTRHPALVPDDMPVIVLIDRFSASASEIVAGALQDHGRATLIGQRSFGKGSVQNFFRLPGASDDEFDDENKNGKHDNWETLTKDHNGNDEFDFAPHIKLTIARYLLPSRRSIHRELDESGDVRSQGGVEPDEEIRQKRWETWKLEEMIKLQGDRSVREYMDEHWDANLDLFQLLALSDSGDWHAYPDFEEWYGGLGTMLGHDDVRFLLRREVRRRVADLRGAAFPRGDYQQDYQLQRAIAAVLESLGRDWHAIPEFLLTFGYEAAGGVDRDGESVAAATEGDKGRQSVRDALELIAAARSSESELSEEDLQRLAELLSELDH